MLPTFFASVATLPDNKVVRDDWSEEESESDVEVVEEQSELSDKQHREVLEGVSEVTPLKKDSTGVAEAAKFGYQSKLISNWYEHKCQYQSCPDRWSEFDNVDDDGVDLKHRTSQIPIVHRHIYVKKHWVTSSVTFQDPAMRVVLAEVLRKYQDLDCELENWTFQPPFMPLVHRWDALKKYHASAEAEDLKSASSALLAFLAPILATSIISLAQTKKTGKVNFQNIWQIFPPRSLVMTKFYGVDTICRVIKYKHRPADRCNPEGWVIDMEYVDWNGENSGYATTSLTIWEFEGYRRVTALPVFPISFLNDIEGTKAKILERGRKFERLRGYHFMVCNGTKVLLETEKPEQRTVSTSQLRTFLYVMTDTISQVTGRVCVDAYAYYRSRNVVKPNLRPLYKEVNEEDSDDASADDTDMSDTPYEMKFSVAPVEVASAAKGPAERTEDLRPLTEEHLLLTSPWLKGFDLKSKDWCELRVDELKDLAWNDEAFEKLVLPGGEKELAWAFVENKSLSKTGFDDFIPDKGRGLIILMFGPPGVGKTFTAEAVADRSRVPLYMMSAGDLGTQPADVEKTLDRALELCRMWNAMLLLDEADVFLGARTNESLARNELVSIFLTKLEVSTPISLLLFSCLCLKLPHEIYILLFIGKTHLSRLHYRETTETNANGTTVLPGNSLPDNEPHLQHRPRLPVPCGPVPPIPRPD